MNVEECIKQLQRGDKGAFRPIVEAYQAEIRTLIACHGISLADVDDIAQAAFLHVYQHIAQYTCGTNFPAWVRAVATYKARAFLEEKRREAKNRGSLLEHYLLEQNLRTPGEGQEDRARRLASCLDRLGQRARTLIRRRCEGVPLATIAAEWGRTIPAVKMMLLRIRTQLRRCVEGQA